jgi:cytochrome c oxidase cbb3-type subunit 1
MGEFGVDWQLEMAGIAVWVAFALNFVITVFTRKTRRIHISNWFVLGMTVMTACLYLDNVYSILLQADSSLSQLVAGKVPFGSSRAMFNLCLITGVFGALYYLIPERTGRPLFSNRLAVIQFCSLLLILAWQGLIHLGYAHIPDRSSAPGDPLEMILLLALLGGVLNGVLSLTDTLDKLRTDPVLRFLLAALLFYVLSLVQNPVALDLQESGLSRYTDWTVGDGHVLVLGWFAMAASGVLYHLVENSWNLRIYSGKLIKLHFWMLIIGVVVYVAAIRIAGIMQGLMWRAYDEYGTLAYTFAESVEAMHPYYVMRFVGGSIFGVGVAVMLYNILMTIYQARRQGGNRSASGTGSESNRPSRVP